MALCLSHHSPNVQQSGNMLFPVERRMEAGRQEDDFAHAINWWHFDSFFHSVIMKAVKNKKIWTRKKDFHQISKVNFTFTAAANTNV